MKNAKPIAIHLDRLAHALTAQGVELKRGQLLEVAAAAFGHRTSNETSRLAADGSLTPPSPQPIGTVELGQDSILVMRDPTSGLPYAVARTFLEEIAQDRSLQFSPTPYGSLADMRRVALSEVPQISIRTQICQPQETLWQAVIQTGDGFHGHTFFTENSAANLATEISAWCVEHWDSARMRNNSLPQRTASLTDLEVIQLYFEAWAGDEFLIMEGQESLTDILEQLSWNIAEPQTPKVVASAPTDGVLDGRYRSYSAAFGTNGKMDETSHLSSHDTLDAAMAACKAIMGDLHDAVVVDHVGRHYWQASESWRRQSMPELALTGDPNDTIFHLTSKDLLKGELSDELHRIADMIDEDYSEGETIHRGWWWRVLSDKAVKDAKSDHGICQRCDSELDQNGRCSDETCPFSDYDQEDPRGWAGHPDMDPN